MCSILKYLKKTLQNVFRSLELPPHQSRTRLFLSDRIASQSRLGYLLKSGFILQQYTMHRLYFKFILLSIILSICCGANQDVVNNDLVNSKVQRTVDLSTHLPKISSSITLENAGKSTVRYFLVALSMDQRDHLSFIGATVSIENNAFRCNCMTIYKTCCRILFSWVTLPAAPLYSYSHVNKHSDSHCARLSSSQTSWLHVPYKKNKPMCFPRKKYKD